MKNKLKTQQKKTTILKKKIKPMIKTQIWQEKNQRETERYIDMLEKYYKR